MLQFITSDIVSVSPTQQILDAIEGGCRWIQIRMKDASDEEIKKVFYDIRDKAKETLTTIIINDRVDLVKSLGWEGVAGVHLGLKDMPASEARLELGPDAIIGVTAHSFEEVESYRGKDIDYIGVGPFNNTDTKKDLAPLLGLEGLAEIVLRAKDLKMEFPLVAVGGITLDDVTAILEVGANGIAVSGAIAGAKDIAAETRRFIDLLPLPE